MDISRDQPAEPLEAFAAQADLARIGPLSLVEQFDIAMAERLQVADPAPHTELRQLLSGLEADGFIFRDPPATPPAEPGPASAPSWRWYPEFRTAVHDDFARREPERVRQLDARLVDWFADRDDASGAFAHAMAAQDWPLIADVLEEF